MFFNRTVQHQHDERSHQTTLIVACARGKKSSSCTPRVCAHISLANALLCMCGHPNSSHECVLLLRCKWSNIPGSGSQLYNMAAVFQAALQRYRGRLAVLLLLVLLIVAVIVDQAARGCCTVDSFAASPSCEWQQQQSAEATNCCFQACLNRGFDMLTNWIAEETVTGSIVLTFVLAGCAMILIPASALTIGVGAAFARALGVGLGVLVGSCVVFIGLSAGALLAFLLARYLLHDLVQRQLQRWRVTAAIDAALRHEGLKVMVLLRLSPLIPYNFFNYIIAATSVSFRDYSIALVAMLPATFGYVYIGATVAETAAAAAASGQAGNANDIAAPATPEAEAAASTADAIRIVLLVLGALCTLLAVIAISVLARKQLKRRMDQPEEVVGSSACSSAAPVPAVAAIAT